MSLLCKVQRFWLAIQDMRTFHSLLFVLAVCSVVTALRLGPLVLSCMQDVLSNA